eukprot:gnl/MRDRNA2_/MRDRNA2_78620_c0_seq1.p1 gnl/MRDRNA2_/MRDRNA2_78620_c0~~gnl/MRDRNA2_/MRDRNA2_78620_c0_seq1.p1  ORF type:complete len:151 (+),score=21.19 gnl/MRDRNA2_/MRDRNA2_78620_c0_seq1:41-454(+)
MLRTSISIYFLLAFVFLCAPLLLQLRLGLGLADKQNHNHRSMAESLLRSISTQLRTIEGSMQVIEVLRKDLRGHSSVSHNSDLLDRVMQKFGDPEQAFAAADADGDHALSKMEWNVLALDYLGFPQQRLKHCGEVTM